MRELEKKMEAYFDKLGFAHNTRRSYFNSMMKFVDWCASVNLDHSKASVDDLYTYISSMRERGLSEHTVRERICTVEHFFRATRRKLNPAVFIRFGKRASTIPANLLDDETMVDIYLSLMPRTMRDARNRVIMGLIMFQGLTRNETGLIEVEHIELDKMRIYVPASRKANERYVPLRQMQVQDLEDYLYRLRPQMLVECGRQTGRLFFPFGGGSDVHNLLWILCRDIKLRFPQFRNLVQLRDSRINIWLNAQKQDLRAVQYLCGMRYASSLLRHKRTDTDKLKRKLDLLHPMERL